MERLTAPGKQMGVFAKFRIILCGVLMLFFVGCKTNSTSKRESREEILKQDLSTLRSAIDQYTLDKQKAPQSLEDLISSGYMKQLPEEPTTRRRDCWVPVPEDQMTAIDKKHPGITDVHSCNGQLSSNGIAYSSW
jgi:general secretion pathway protein G